eukprot:TRINITY_DN38887_c0_g1_i1.p1 TRINITY_DN38887_c0_g1~~TRINITY_DN38887_c0_g1_i1.p1  ORF type:complete len:244 (+),score=63.47 TRINITY_DN38887_c0_g1_i1:26-757(+)
MVLTRTLGKIHLDAQFGGRRVRLEATETSGTGARKCEQQVLAELKQLLSLSHDKATNVHMTLASNDSDDEKLTALMDFSEVLPTDAPPGHLAHKKMKFSRCQSLVSFHYGAEHFQVTLRQAGSRSAAEVIARACWLKFELGWSKEQVTAFKKKCVGRIAAATGSLRSMGSHVQAWSDKRAMPVLADVDDCRKRAKIEEHTSPPLPCSVVSKSCSCSASAGVDGDTLEPVSDSDTSTECVVLAP